MSPAQTVVQSLDATDVRQSGGYETAAYLYSSGGRTESRKQFYGGIALYHDLLSPMMPDLEFDFDYFGRRSSRTRMDLDLAMDRGFVRPEFVINASKPPEPPHMRLALTERGLEAAGAYMDVVCDERSGNKSRLEKATAKLLAFAGLPQKVAIPYALATQTRPPLLPTREPLRLRRLGGVSDKSRLSRLVSDLPKLGFVRYQEDWQSLENGFRIVYEIIPERVPKKYQYLYPSPNDSSDDVTYHRSANTFKSRLTSNNDENRPADQIRTKIRESIGERCPEALAREADEREKILGRFGYARARQALDRVIDDAVKVAKLTAEHPVACTLTATRGYAFVEYEKPWSGERYAADIRRTHGELGLRAFLEDPADIFSYLSASMDASRWRRTIQNCAAPTQ